MLVLTGLCAFTAFRCLEQPLEPVVPSWDVPLTLPLANRLHTLSEIVAQDTAMLRAGVGGLISYRASLGAPPTYVGNLISVRPPDTTARMRLGTFGVTSPPMIVPLSIPWLPPGAVVPIPDTTLAFPALQQDVPTFESVLFAEGTIRLTITNNLPVPVDVTGPVALTDDMGRTVATFVFSPATVPANGSLTASDGLAGRTVSHLLTIRGLSLRTAASSGPVPIPAGDLLSATLATTDLRARRAVFAEIPPQVLANNDTAFLTLDDSTLVKELLFTGGTMHFSFNNHVDLAMVFRFRFDELLRRQGATLVAYEDSVTLPAGGMGSFTLDLAGCAVRSLDGGLLHSLRLITSVLLRGGADHPVTVNDTDRVEVRLSTAAPLVIDTAVAVIRPTWLDVNVPVPVSFGELPTRFSGHLDIPTARLGLATAVTFGFPMDLYLLIGARTGPGGGWTYLSVPATQKRIQPGAGSVQFDAGEVGTFLSQFSGGLPDTLTVIGQVLVNPPEVYSPTLAGAAGIGRNSSFNGSIDLDVPLRLGIVDGIYRDTLSLGDTTGDGNADYALDRSRLRDINSGDIFVQLDNGLPLGVAVQVHLLDASGRPLLTVPPTGGLVGVGPAPVDAQGNVTAPVSGRSVVRLTSADVRQFDVAQRVVYSLAFSTPPAAGAVGFRISDHVRVRIWSALSCRVNR